MELKKKIVQTGSSAGIVIDKVVLESLGLEIGDHVVINIKPASRQKKK